MDENPYSAPAPPPLQQMPGAPSAYSVETGRPSPRLVDNFRRTKGWVQFLGIFSIIGGAFCLLGAAGIAMTASTIELASSAAVPFSGFFVIIGVIYAVVGIVSIYLGIRLLKYGTAIGRLSLSNQMADAESAADQQRAVWKILGILAIISIALFGLMMVASIAEGKMSTY